MSDWQELPLGEICGIEIGGTPSRSEERYWWKSDGDGIRLPWVSISDMKEKVITETKESITEVGALQSNCKHVAKGTLLMSFKLTIGRLAFAGRDLYTNEAITAIRPNKDLCPEFLYYGLQHWNLTGDSDQAVKGVTLNKQKLQEIPCLIPPLPEQKKIAEILSGIDRSHAKLSDKIKALTRIRVQLIRQFLTQGGHPKSDHEDILPPDWQIKTLDEVAQFRRGSFPQPYGNPEWFDDNGFPFVQVFDIDDNGRLKSSTKSRISQAGAEKVFSFLAVH
jgi:type I restriction enzyme S subunit